MVYEVGRGLTGRGCRGGMGGRECMTHAQQGLIAVLEWEEVNVVVVGGSGWS